ncbi:hypothetical protein [Streptomyces sp. NPDC059168]|uniref:hypothetical protein n=1 Tax=Streptomyces sp. NPDC059168 TaxID=3346753 RepID=UPI003691270D
MFSGMKIAAVAGLVGGLAAAGAGVAPAFAAGGSAPCVPDLQGDVRCTQRITGEVPEDGFVPHRETCTPVRPMTLPAAVGAGVTRVGPEITCSPATTGASPAEGGDEEGLLGLMP